MKTHGEILRKGNIPLRGKWINKLYCSSELRVWWGVTGATEYCFKRTDVCTGAYAQAAFA
jgi:hypothetical protein